MEFGISSLAGLPRVTLECAPLETPEHARLDATLGLLEKLGVAAPSAEVIAELRQRQSGHRLRWGCWLGLRFGTAVSAKLYLELPRETPDAPRMLGFDIATGAREFYATFVSPDEAAVRARLAGLAPATRQALMRVMAETVGMELARTLTWTPIGVSWDPEDGQRVALFCRARAVVGGNAALASRFAHVPGYQALIAAPGTVPDHNVLSFVPHPDGRIELRAGLSGC